MCIRDSTNKTIMRAALDGSGTVDLFAAPNPDDISGMIYLVDLKIDDQGNRLYWSGGGGIHAVDAAGTNRRQVVDLGFYSHAVAVDREYDAVYYSTYFGTIVRARLDGSDARTLVTGLGSWVMDIAVDRVHNHLYWALYSSGSSWRVQRSDLNGANIETILTRPWIGTGLALDVAGGKLYWLEHTGVWRANMAPGAVAERAISDITGSPSYYSLYPGANVALGYMAPLPTHTPTVTSTPTRTATNTPSTSSFTTTMMLLTRTLSCTPM